MAKYDDDSSPVNQVVLDKIKFHSMKRISREFMGAMVREHSESSAVDYCAITGDRIGRDIALEFEAFVLGKKKYKSDTVSYPFDWVEAVKERFAPDWIKERWPIRYRVVTMDVHVHWPTLNVMVPDHVPILRFDEFRDIEAGSPTRRV